MRASVAGALWVLVAYSLFIVIAALVTVLNDRFWGLPLVPVFGGPIHAAPVAVVLALTVFGLNVLATRAGSLRAVERELAEAVRPLTGLGPWPLAVASGVAEEWVFRGLLMPFAGLWLQGLVFGLLHWPGNRRLWPWTLWTIVMGWALGALTLHFGALWPAMLTHALINGLSLTRLSKTEL
jgi:membrane protease YdiL (CAAX protease family)